MNEQEAATPFLTDSKTPRAQARKNPDSGHVTFTCGGDVRMTIDAHRG